MEEAHLDHERRVAAEDTTQHRPLLLEAIARQTAGPDNGGARQDARVTADGEPILDRIVGGRAAGLPLGSALGPFALGRDVLVDPADPTRPSVVAGDAGPQDLRPWRPSATLRRKGIAKAGDVR